MLIYNHNLNFWIKFNQNAKVADFADGAEGAPRSIRSNTQVSFHIWWLLESCDKLPDTDHLATFGPFSEFIK